MRVLVALLAFAFACGPVRVPPDGGSVDDSCGIDCAAQNQFGLMANRCFEYSTSTTDSMVPELGAWVKPVFTLEGGIKVMPVEYRKGGQTLMVDSFGFENGTLKLMRREFSRQGRSTTFLNDANVITGVTWLGAEPAAGQNLSTTTNADNVDASGTHMVEKNATYRVTTLAPTMAQLKTPLMQYTSGIRMLTTQDPEHGADAIRVFVPKVGFISIASPFNFAGGNATPVYLQRIRDLGTPDAGPESCSLGVP